MIIVDTSALVSVLRNEPDAKDFLDILDGREDLATGAPTKFELLLVMGRWGGEPAVNQARRLLEDCGIQVLDWTDRQAELAVEAFLRFGKTRHPAALNLGDCMSYAIAKSLGAPLLFKGNDFHKTDIEPALAA